MRDTRSLAYSSCGGFAWGVHFLNKISVRQRESKDSKTSGTYELETCYIGEYMGEYCSIKGDSRSLVQIVLHMLRKLCCQV